MYKFRRYSKRTIAAILSLMIVISAISTLFTGLSASAATTGAITDIADDTIPTGNNIMAGRIYSSAVLHNDKLATTFPVGGSNNAKYLTDGSMTTTGWFTGSIAGNKSFACWDKENNKPVLNVDGSVYVDLTYNLSGTATIERFYIGNHIDKELRCKKFAIYMSDSDDEDLFSEGNHIMTVENNDGARGQEITFSTPITGVRNIGIRVINPVWDEDFALSKITYENTVENNTCEVYPRIDEIAAFGTFEADPFVFQKVINNSVHALPNGIVLDGLNNLSTPLRPEVQGTNTLTTNVPKKISFGSADKMKDGDFSTEGEIGAYKFADWNSGDPIYYMNGELYLDIYYDLGSTADLKYIVIGNHPTRELVTGKYDVYIGNDKASLYDSSNLYTTVDNIATYDKGGSNMVNVILFDKEETGVDNQVRYVGIRIYTPVCAVGVTDDVTVTDSKNYINARIREFSAYGTYLDPNYVAGVNKFEDTKDMVIADIFNHGENLLTKENTTYLASGKNYEPSGSTKTSINNFWADNSGAKHYDISAVQNSISDGFAFVSKLDKYELTQIQGFAYQGITENNEPYYASHIQVHVSEEREDILNDSTVVAEYYLEDDGVNKGLYYEFPEGKEPQGNYFAIELVNPVYTATKHIYPRISLLYAWGREGELRGVPANIAENMPIDIYFNYNGEFTEVTETNLTGDEAQLLTDGNDNTSAVIDTRGSKRNTVELIYNLCSDIKIDELALSTLIDSTYGFKTMKVYTAGSIVDVNREDALIWTYKTGSATGNISPTKSFAPAKEMRYIKFVFEGTKDYLKIGEIEAIGMDYQKMKTRNITSDLSTDQIDLTRTNMETGKQTYPTVKSTYIQQFYDNNAGTEFIFSEGTVGRDKYDILFYLGDLRTVSSISNSFYKHFMKYTPASVNVYVSDSLAEVSDPETEPTYVINREDLKNGEYTKNLRPMLARYVRFEFKDFGKFEEYVNPDGSYRITALIGDIKIIGTKVKGLNPDEEDNKLIGFYDEKTGLTATILKYNGEVNDVFTDAVSIRVTPEKATNWQMRSLQPSRFEVLEKKIYKVEFLDLYGNIVKNLGDREVSFSCKTPAGYEGSNIMFGDASQRAKMTGLDTTYENDISTAVYRWDPTIDNKIAILGLIAADDPYWDTIGELENFDEGNEDDLKVEIDAEIHDELWYDSIHTEDDAFVVTPLDFSFEDGIKFTAENISATAPEERYIEVLSQAYGKKVAAYYDMKLTDKGENLHLGGQWVEIAMNLADGILENYTDLEVFHVDDNGTATILWSMVDGEKLIFQTDSFSDFVIVGTALDGSTSIDDGSSIIDDSISVDDGSEDIDDLLSGESPSTGEDARGLYVALLFLVAAGYVALRFSRKSVKE